MDDLSSQNGEHRGKTENLLFRYGEIVGAQHSEVRMLPNFDRSQVVLVV